VINTLSWLAWLAGALLAVSQTRNPLYLVLLLLCCGLVSLAVSRAAPGLRSPLSLPRLAALMVGLGALFNALTSHYGETVLFSLPEWLPLLGGPVTLEGLAYGAINGLVLACILTAFTTFNRALPVKSLLRLAPRAFYPLALITSIAMTFLPSMLRQFQLIREAQAIRGHRVRGVRDWLPLLMPLLVGGLERALQLAEAMTARGFASAPSRQDGTAGRLALLGGLGLLAVGWVLSLSGWFPPAAWLMMAAGALAVGGVFWMAGRRSPRTVYHREGWSARDAVVIGGALLALAGFLVLPAFLPETELAYSPYPVLTLPGFDPLLGMAALGLLGPALALRREADELQAG
jgi:energy-coupling factor transport system permease protein